MRGLFDINFHTMTCNPCGNAVEECECKDREVRVIARVPPMFQDITDLEPLDIELDTRHVG